MELAGEDTIDKNLGEAAFERRLLNYGVGQWLLGRGNTDAMSL